MDFVNTGVHLNGSGQVSDFVTDDAHIQHIGACNAVQMFCTVSSGSPGQSLPAAEPCQPQCTHLNPNAHTKNRACIAVQIWCAQHCIM